MRSLKPLLSCLVALAGCGSPGSFSGVERSSALFLEGATLEQTREVAEVMDLTEPGEFLLDAAGVDRELRTRVLIGPPLEPASYATFASVGTPGELGDADPELLEDEDAVVVFRTRVFASCDRPGAEPLPGHLIVAIQVLVFHRASEEPSWVRALAESGLEFLETNTCSAAGDLGFPLVEYKTPGRPN